MPLRRKGEKSFGERLPWTRKSSKNENGPPAFILNRTGSKQTDKDSAIPNFSTLKEEFDPWLEAQQFLRKDETLNEKWEKSVHILTSRLGLKYEDDGNAPRVKDLRTFLDAMTQRLDDKKWTVQDDSGQSGTRQKLAKVCKNILVVKDVINTAAAASPPAAIACAGVTVGLLLFIQAMEQNEILLQGLDMISSMLPRLHLIEHHFLHRDTDLSADMRITLQRDMIQLCAKILEFQSRAICYLEKPAAKQILADMLKREGWNEILQDIERYDTLIKDAVSSVHVSEVDRKLDDLLYKQQQMQVWQATSAQDEKKFKLFKRLYTCLYKDHKDRNNKRVPGTCEWFTSHPQFTEWNQSGNSELLWVSADPGCGKSVLARYLADEYLPSGVRTVCYFFFKDDDADQKRATNALASVLHQLLIAQPHLVQESLLDKSETSGDLLVKSFNELWNIFVQVTADENAGEVVCLFDALDECQEDDRKTLIQAIENLLLRDLGKRSLKILITSRPYDHIRYDFFRLEKSIPTIRLSGESEENTEKISIEIDLVIKERVREIGERNSLRPDECDFIVDQLTSIPNRTYLWVSLALNVIERMPGFSKGNVQNAILDIPKDVEAAYTRILDRSLDHGKARKLLHIVTAAERPLTLREISLALAFNTNGQSIREIADNIQTDDERIKRTIRDLCGLFLAVIDGKVYLLHQTAKEFLVRQSQDSINEDTKACTWKHSLHPGESHYILAGICTLYLIQDTTQDIFHGFVDYAANHWAAHVRRGSVSSIDTIAKRGLTLCQPDSKLSKAWRAIYRPSQPHFPDSDSILIASYLGLTAVTDILLQTRQVNLESKDSTYENGHEGVVKLLLETGKRMGMRELSSCFLRLERRMWSPRSLGMVALLYAGLQRKDMRK
ncbi:ankyrin repeat protein [Aspergillus similis]